MCRLSRQTRGGTAEPVSREDYIIRRERGNGNVYFPCSADHEQDWQPYPVDLHSATWDDHTIYQYYTICVVPSLMISCGGNQAPHGDEHSTILYRVVHPFHLLLPPLHTVRQCSTAQSTLSDDSLPSADRQTHTHPRKARTTKKPMRMNDRVKLEIRLYYWSLSSGPRMVCRLL